MNLNENENERQVFEFQAVYWDVQILIIQTFNPFTPKFKKDKLPTFLKRNV